jgi:XTP/dITP diphosphohydrolase
VSERAAGEPGAGNEPVAGTRLLELVEVIDRLRTACPWDATQTHASLAPFLLEETYEALDALDSGDADAIREELGDVLLQVVFHARVAAERDDGTGYTIDDVAAGIIAKLTRRHPHVFSDVIVSGAEEVSANWDAIKSAERSAATGAPSSAFDGVPAGQPALALTAAYQRRAERAGAPTQLAELTEHVDAGWLVAGAHLDPGEPAAAEGGSGEPGDSGPEDEVSEIGAELFALVARARAAGLDPELELRSAARIYRKRVLAWEREEQG